jgi:hypothetical protein
MNWLARLKKTQIPPETDATNATKPGFVGFVASIPAHIPKTQGVSAAANDPAPATPQPAELPDPDPDRWCWPFSSAMTRREIDTMGVRIALFHQRGLTALDAELLADKLVARDRDFDNRSVCLECSHLTTGRAMRCAQWQRAGLGQPGIPAGMALQLQRCDGFSEPT